MLVRGRFDIDARALRVPRCVYRPAQKLTASMLKQPAAVSADHRQWMQSAQSSAVAKPPWPSGHSDASAAAHVSLVGDGALATLQFPCVQRFWSESSSESAAHAGLSSPQSASSWIASPLGSTAVSYTHLTLPTTPYV